MAFFKEQLVDIKGFVFDIDGVMASSRVVLHPGGDLMRTMNTKDGYAIQKAVTEGFQVAIISGARSESIRSRFEALGVSQVYLDSRNKVNDLNTFSNQSGIEFDSIIYMGDDMPDLPPMKRCGLACCPSDAVAEVQAASHYISEYPGGEGCVRDIIEQVLRAQKKWNSNL